MTKNKTESIWFFFAYTLFIRIGLNPPYRRIRQTFIRRLLFYGILLHDDNVERVLPSDISNEHITAEKRKKRCTYMYIYVY